MAEALPQTFVYTYRELRRPIINYFSKTCVSTLRLLRYSVREIPVHMSGWETDLLAASLSRGTGKGATRSFLLPDRSWGTNLETGAPINSQQVTSTYIHFHFIPFSILQPPPVLLAQTLKTSNIISF